MLASAQDACQNILDQLRHSNLNFKLIETPYSAEVIVRKRFIKESEGPNPYFVIPPPSSEINDFRNRNNILEQENIYSLNCIKEREDTIKLLEDKLERVKLRPLIVLS